MLQTKDRGFNDSERNSTNVTSPSYCMKTKLHHEDVMEWRTISLVNIRHKIGTRIPICFVDDIHDRELLTKSKTAHCVLRLYAYLKRTIS
ncbi:hypothetical protein H5410_037252 [Solanum commersonii]|uniref:Uncharacterized protein n=1 Tax=Solanum commersonii TaxID=4109 RepID=A0A9J5Y9P2_SOLCO|nr:hypothetical protein H5410_037252 [Solanum commersonii]